MGTGFILGPDSSDHYYASKLTTFPQRLSLGYIYISHFQYLNSVSSNFESGNISREFSPGLKLIQHFYIRLDSI